VTWKQWQDGRGSRSGRALASCSPISLFTARYWQHRHPETVQEITDAGEDLETIGDGKAGLAEA
jgi:hypothetical protein